MRFGALTEGRSDQICWWVAGGGVRGEDTVEDTLREASRMGNWVDVSVD